MKLISSCAILAMLIFAPAGLSVAQTTSSINVDIQPQPLPTMPAKPVEKPLAGQIISQDHDTFLASVVVGSKVYSSDNKKVGSVNDFIAKPNGQMVGVVIGVGGFLGMGQKNIALPLSMIDISQSADFTSAKVVLKVPSAELAVAPQFMSARVLAAEEQALKDQQAQQQQMQPFDLPKPATR